MLVGFNIGDLLLRHTQYYAQKNEFSWLKVLSKCMYLGTPNNGSPLEKFGLFSGEVIRRIPRKDISHLAD